MELSVYKTRGIILKKTNLNDTDRLLTIYMEKFGKILVRAKGIGKKESKLKSLIEQFNLYEFILAKSKNIDVLANSYFIKEFVYLRSNLENLALAIYFAELVDKLIPEPERDDKIWALLVRAMEMLDNAAKINSPPKRGEAPSGLSAHPPLNLRGGEENLPPPSHKASEGQSPPSFIKGGGIPPFEKGRVGEILTLSNLKAAFEEKLLEFLGHPTFAMRGKTTEREKMHYLASLAGEEIKSEKFLKNFILI